MTSRRHENKKNRWQKRALLAALGWLGSCGDTPFALEHACDDYCENVERASCPNAAPRSDCELGCVNNGALLQQCRSAWRDFVTCMSNAQVACGADGVDTPPAGACEKDQRALDDCVAAQ